MFNKALIYNFLFLISSLYCSFNDFTSFPIQESGRIKPLDTYAKNQLIAIYGSSSIKTEESEIQAIEWLLNLITDTENELKREVFFISNWSNSPEVEISLGLDLLNRDSHIYSFYEIVEGFRNNSKLLESLKTKQEELTFVEKQIIDIYSKLVFYDEIAHSFKCMIPFLEIQNQDIRNQLKLKENQKLSYAFFVRNVELFSPLMQELLDTKSSKWNEKHRELSTIASKLQLQTQYDYAQALKIFPSKNQDEEWLSPWELMDHSKVTDEQKILLDLLENSIVQYMNRLDENKYIPEFSNALTNFYPDVSISNLEREVSYNNNDYFTKSMIIYILSIIFLGIGFFAKMNFMYPLSLITMFFGMIIHGYGIIIRMIIMSRPPVTTLYESIIFVSFVLVLISILIEFIKKDYFGLIVGCIGGIILHFIGLKYASDGDTLGMLVAVLNSNFWLATHVTTITFGYGVSIAAGLMAHLYLVVLLFKSEKINLLKTIHSKTYILTLVALFFTLFGTILGGIWADQSWGRFWGWDPKENGALLIVMWHLMMLHMRVSGMVGKDGFALGTSLVNIIVALAWFGVNLLSVGLHSYGFTDSIATNLFAFIAFELLFCFGIYFYCKFFKNSKLTSKEV